MDVNGVYKPTNITGGGHPVWIVIILKILESTLSNQQGF